MGAWSKGAEEKDYDLNDIYKPLKDLIHPVRKALEDFDIDLHLGPVARLLIHYKLPYRRHRALRKDIEAILKMGFRYEKTFFDLKNQSRGYFDRLMKRYGYYAPTLKEYRYLQMEFYRPIIFENEREAWVMSFNNRLEALKLRSERQENAKTPEEILAMGIQNFQKKVRKLRRSRDEMLDMVIAFEERLDRAIKNPSIPWERLDEKEVVKRQVP